MTQQQSLTKPRKIQTRKLKKTADQIQKEEMNNMINVFLKTVKDGDLNKDEIERFSKTVQKTNKFFVPKDEVAMYN